MSNRLLFIFLLVAPSAFPQDKGMFIVTRDYRMRPSVKTATIVLDWKSLQMQGDFDVTNANFGKKLTKKIVDRDGDNQPDQPDGKPVAFTSSTSAADPRLKITYLTNKTVFESLQRDYVFFDDEGRLYFDGTVKFSGLGDLDYYLASGRRLNDLKGFGALLYLAMELD